MQEIVDSNFDLYKRITDDSAFGAAIKNFLFDQYLRAHREAEELGAAVYVHPGGNRDRGVADFGRVRGGQRGGLLQRGDGGAVATLAQGVQPQTQPVVGVLYRDAVVREGVRLRRRDRRHRVGGLQSGNPSTRFAMMLR